MRDAFSCPLCPEKNFQYNSLLERYHELKLDFDLFKHHSREEQDKIAALKDAEIAYLRSSLDYFTGKSRETQTFELRKDQMRQQPASRAKGLAELEHEKRVAYWRKKADEVTVDAVPGETQVG